MSSVTVAVILSTIFNSEVVAVTPSNRFNSVAVAVTDNPVRVAPGTASHTPAPSPSEVHTCPSVPADVMAFSTLLADNVPSARSVKSASAACLASNCVCTAEVTPST